MRLIKYLGLPIFLFLIFSGAAAAGERLLNEGVIGNMSAQETAFTGAAGFGTSATVGSVMATIIKSVLGLLGIIFIVLLVFAGYQWMTASGNEEKVAKAKDTIVRATIGLLIVLAAYSITYFVFNALNKSTGGSGGTQQNQGGSSGT